MAIIEQHLLKAGLPYVEDCYCEFQIYDQVIHGLKYVVSITVDIPDKLVRVSLHFIDTEPKQLFLLGALWCDRAAGAEAYSISYNWWSRLLDYRLYTLLFS
jgi:hypothetical protein